ncbi:chorismate mutase [Owenweeksia hongkongensis]|uniref:chorismate mutase n=1 Tax=Owenweeksia hongkongensis TaxID=253245 RepID=UPI003A9244A2
MSHHFNTMQNHLDILPKEDWLNKDQKPYYIFGPCSAESPEQTMETAKQIVAEYPNATYRAGIWKPRTRPNNFEGAGEQGLDWLKSVKQETGLKISTEVADAHHVEACLKAGVDVLWVGARTTVNPFSVQAIADALQGVDITIFVKNPIVPDIQLWMGALERINQAGVKKLGAIHRGFHFHNSEPYRNLPRWEMPLEMMGQYTNLPMICDVSHISGNPQLIPSVAQKAMDLNMQGLMVETHITPEKALSDAKQQITPSSLKKLIDGLILRSPTADNPEFENMMEALRQKIDEIDRNVLSQFSNRMNLVREIGVYKKENNVTIFQPSRWEAILRRSLEDAVNLELSPTFVKGLYMQIHDESIRQQTEVMNTKAAAK